MANCSCVRVGRIQKTSPQAKLEMLACYLRKATTDSEINGLVNEIRNGLRSTPALLSPCVEAALFDVIEKRSAVISTATRQLIVSAIAIYSYPPERSAARIAPQFQMDTLARQLEHAKADRHKSSLLLQFEAIPGGLTSRARKALGHLIASPVNLKLSEATQRRALSFLNGRLNGPEMKVVEKVVEREVQVPCPSSGPSRYPPIKWGRSGGYASGGRYIFE